MFSYKPLWMTLIEKELKKTDLCELIGIAGSTLAKMGKNEYVALEVINRICQYLDVPVEKVIRYVKDE